MKSNRRKFLKNSIIGAGVFSTGIFSFGTIKGTESNKGGSREMRQQDFNMCGYAAPAIDTVRVGIIGLGNRGSVHIETLSHIENVELVAMCDLHRDRVDRALKVLNGSNKGNIKTYYGSEEAYKELCEQEGIDLIIITTPWEWHTPMAVYAMKNGKHTAVEVPASKTLEECWELVDTSEKTKKHCMMLENCCYGFFELLTLNMARKGYFGEIVHGEGAYIHDLKDHLFSKTYYEDVWRLRENAERNGNLYPTHGLGPVCQIMNINRGDQMEYLTSIQSNDFGMSQEIKELASQDSFYEEFTNRKFRGNMNTSLIRTYKGRTIMVQHDVTSTRPYSRIHLISGTKAIARKWPSPARISDGHSWLDEEKMDQIQREYMPDIVSEIGEKAKEVGGHGGMDFLMMWRLIDCLRNGLPLDQDVYDAALWSSIGPLSEWSVAHRSDSVDIPDFTRGAWKTNEKVNISLQGGGNTGIRKIPDSKSAG